MKSNVRDNAVPAQSSTLSQKIPSLGKPRSHKKASSKPSNPPIETPVLPSPAELTSTACRHPVRRILSHEDHERFLSSPSHTLITAFAFNLADSIRGTPVTEVAKQERSPAISSLLTSLDKTEQILLDNPAEDNNGSRFGNPAFRTFVSSVSSRSQALHHDLLSVLPAELRESALDEVCTYFNNAWGSSTRIDYGSGHELNYLIYLLCLNRLSILPSSDFQQAALIVFPRYLKIMRKIQDTYYLEPAGSHGVWGLDDYHFLPFLFGAAQLESHPFIRPLSIHNTATIDAYGDEYVYLDMVRHVNSTKTVQGLRWHSPMLDDISGVKEGWGKIYQGMRRMFLHEVIGKLVVMQHFLFGGLVPAAEGMTEPNDVHRSSGSSDSVDESHQGHVHDPTGWGDCCGIQVPSSVGAAQELRKQGRQQLRPLPFD